VLALGKTRIVETVPFGYTASFEDNKFPGTIVASNDTGVRDMELNDNALRQFDFYNVYDEIVPTDVDTGDGDIFRISLLAFIFALTGVAVRMLRRRRRVVRQG
jgi:hypothetical protein